MSLIRSSLAIIAFCVAGLLGLVVFGFWAAGEAMESEEELSHILAVEASLDSLHASGDVLHAKDVEVEEMGEFFDHLEKARQGLAPLISDFASARTINGKLSQVEAAFLSYSRQSPEIGQGSRPDQQARNQIPAAWEQAQFHFNEIDAAINELIVERLSELDQQASYLVLTFVVATVVFGLLCVAAAMLLYGRVIGPAAALAKTIAMVASGNRATRVRIRGHDELASVGQAFNDLLDKKDETERRLIVQQETIQEQARLLEIGGRAARLGGWLVDGELRRCRWSDTAAEILQVSPEWRETGIRQALSLFRKQDQAALVEAGQNCRKHGEPFDLEVALAEDGSHRVFRVLGVRAYSQDQAIVQGAIQEVTEYRQLKDRLSQSQKLEAVGRLTTGIAHDFNNLLTVIMGNADVLGEEQVGASERKAIAALIVKNAEQGAALTRNLLAFAMGRPGKPEWLDLKELLGDLDNMIRVSLGERIELTVSAIADLGQLWVDKAQMEAVVLNLAMNARDAMPSGGRFTITADLVDSESEGEETKQPAKRFVRLAFSDTGSGIEKEAQQHIFEPFYTSKPDGKGTGLGLYMVAGFAEQAGGSVWVDSEPGRGTSITLSLPVRLSGVNFGPAQPGLQHKSQWLGLGSPL
ncbi:ATP-binding protein [Marinobacter sediminum]|uniref:ATP-binding protein n=1 Tax=Marinobacter sediminum TaxID=256323 RepID=UPI003566A6D0